MTEILDRNDPDTLNRTVECLNRAGVVLVPTDTVYGLAVLPTHSASVERLFAIKSRPASVNLPVMVAHSGQLTDLGAEIGSAAGKLLDSALVPGALTVVLDFHPPGLRFGLQDAKRSPFAYLTMTFCWKSFGEPARYWPPAPIDMAGRPRTMWRIF